MAYICETLRYNKDMKQEKAIFAAGCFWGVQHQFQRVPGVLNTVVGYTGGPEENPKYPEVKAHQTHHVEAIVVDYDADIVSYEDLCKVFFEIHDPTQTDGVGPDIGPQYRSEIFYLNEEQKEIAEKVLSPDKDHPQNPTPRDSKDIGIIMSQMDGWEKSSKPEYTPGYGRQRGWLKVAHMKCEEEYDIQSEELPY